MYIEHTDTHKHIIIHNSDVHIMMHTQIHVLLWIYDTLLYTLENCTNQKHFISAQYMPKGKCEKVSLFTLFLRIIIQEVKMVYKPQVHIPA